MARDWRAGQLSVELQTPRRDRRRAGHAGGARPAGRLLRRGCGRRCWTPRWRRCRRRPRPTCAREALTLVVEGDAAVDPRRPGGHRPGRGRRRSRLTGCVTADLAGRAPWASPVRAGANGRAPDGRAYRKLLGCDAGLHFGNGVRLTSASWVASRNGSTSGDRRRDRPGRRRDAGHPGRAQVPGVAAAPVRLGPLGRAHAAVAGQRDHGRGRRDGRLPRPRHRALLGRQGRLEGARAAGGRGRRRRDRQLVGLADGPGGAAGGRRGQPARGRGPPEGHHRQPQLHHDGRDAGAASRCTTRPGWWRWSSPPTRRSPAPGWPASPSWTSRCARSPTGRPS